MSVDATSYYHCVSRCVRRSYLCGKDAQTGTCYEHRRLWIEQRIYALTHVYCIDICAYAIMSNHYHLVANINKVQATALSQHEVVERWGRTHKLPVLIQRWLSNQLSDKAEQEKCVEIIETWRERLWNLSWFMKELNFDIACKANQEDNCTGHFWESRFKSQALLDEKALAAAMAYVDLNPIRAGIATTLETSDYTSIKARLNALKNQQPTAPCLHPFIGNPTNKMSNGIPLRLIDYIELVDWTARQFREDKAQMNQHLPAILARLDVTQTNWLKVCTHMEKTRATAIGTRTLALKTKAVLNKERLHVYHLE
ncbi:transposase [Vibrio barjaei]|nr:transposase [Vibrio barjaei]